MWSVELMVTGCRNQNGVACKMSFRFRVLRGYDAAICAVFVVTVFRLNLEQSKE